MLASLPFRHIDARNVSTQDLSGSSLRRLARGRPVPRSRNEIPVEANLPVVERGASGFPGFRMWSHESPASQGSNNERLGMNNAYGSQTNSITRPPQTWPRGV